MRTAILFQLFSCMNAISTGPLLVPGATVLEKSGYAVVSESAGDVHCTTTHACMHVSAWARECGSGRGVLPTKSVASSARQTDSLSPRMQSCIPVRSLHRPCLPLQAAHPLPSAPAERCIQSLPSYTRARGQGGASCWRSLPQQQEQQPRHLSKPTSRWKV